MENVEDLVKALTALAPATENCDLTSDHSIPDVLGASGSLVSENVLAYIGPEGIQCIAEEVGLGIFKSNSGSFVLVGYVDSLTRAKTLMEKAIMKVKTTRAVGDAADVRKINLPKKRAMKTEETKTRKHQKIEHSEVVESTPRRLSRRSGRVSYADLANGRHVLKDKITPVRHRISESSTDIVEFEYNHPVNDIIDVVQNDFVKTEPRLIQDSFPVTKETTAPMISKDKVKGQGKVKRNSNEFMTTVTKRKKNKKLEKEQESQRACKLARTKATVSEDNDGQESISKEVTADCDNDVLTCVIDKEGDCALSDDTKTGEQSLQESGSIMPHVRPDAALPAAGAEDSIEEELPHRGAGNEEDGVEVKVEPQDSPAANDTVTCESCNFQCTSTEDLIKHKKETHSSESVCDICFNTYSNVARMMKHRKFHFNLKDGSLKESAILLHKQALVKRGLTENLKPELAKYIYDYDLQNEKGQGTSSIDFLVMVDMSSSETHDGGGENNQSTSTPDESRSKIKDIYRANTNIDVLGKYVCEICGSSMITMRLYMRHMKSQHGSKSYKTSKKSKDKVKKETRTQGNKELHKCPHCNFECARIQNFQRHLNAHKKPELYKCDFCNYTNSQWGEVNRHKRNAHSEKNVLCDLCPTRFRNRILLNQHHKQKHSNIYRTMCDVCGLKMTNTALKTHMKNKHGPTSEEDNKRSVCKKCGKICRTKAAYETHMAKFHTEANNAEEAEIEAALVKLPETRDNDGPQYACKLCHYQGKYPRAVVRHIIQVHAERRHACDKCGGAFPRASLLERHVAVYHEGVERSQCQECGHWFRSKSNLKGHMVRVHLTEPLHRCELCNKGFYLHQSLLQHMEIHRPVEDREYKYTCEKCDQKFRYKSAFKSHMMVHDGIRPYGCLICSKSFLHASSLEKHLVVHTDHRPFVCSHCGKAFKMKKYLDAHIMSHDTPSVDCKHCGHLFPSQEALKRHNCSCIVIQPEVVIETACDMSTSQFVCTKCGEMFSDSSLASVHQCEEVGANVEAMTTQLELDAEDADHQGNRFICMACGDQFQDEAQANQHVCTETFALAAGDVSVFPGNVSGTVVLEQADMETVSELGNYVNKMEVEEETENSNEGNTVTVMDSCSFASGDGKNSDLVDNLSVTESVSNLIVSEQVLSSTGNVIEDQSKSTGETVPSEALPVFMCGVCEEMFLTDEEVNTHIIKHDNDTLNTDSEFQGEEWSSKQELASESEDKFSINQLCLTDGASVVKESDPGKCESDIDASPIL